MHFVIDYLYYKVKIQEDIGLYNHLKSGLAKQFKVYEGDNDFVENSSYWSIVFTEGLFSEYKEFCKEKVKIEHNIFAEVYETDEYSVFLSDRGDWIIKINADNSISVEVDNDCTAYFITRKILFQISRFENNKNENVLLHSSSLVCNNKGFAFVGKKGAGKTTILMNLLLNNKNSFYYLGNDIVAIDKHKMLYAMFSKVGIGTGSLEFINKNMEKKYPILDESKYYYDMQTFYETFGLKSINAAPLTAVFIIENSSSDSFKCVKSEGLQAVDKIRSEIMQDGKHEELSDHPNWLIKSQVNDREECCLDDVCNEISETIPCYFLEFNMTSEEHFNKLSQFIRDLSR
jgi:hypothetical protein